MEVATASQIGCQATLDGILQIFSTVIQFGALYATVSIAVSNRRFNHKHQVKMYQIANYQKYIDNYIEMKKLIISIELLSYDILADLKNSKDIILKLDSQNKKIEVAYHDFMYSYGMLVKLKLILPKEDKYEKIRTFGSNVKCELIKACNEYEGIDGNSKNQNEHFLKWSKVIGNLSKNVKKEITDGISYAQDKLIELYEKE